MPCIALCEVSFIETLLVYFYFLPLKLTSSFCCQIGWFYFFRSFAFLFEHYYKMRCLFGMLSIHTTGGIIHFHCYIPSSHHSYSVCVWEGLYFIIYISQLYYQHLGLCFLSRHKGSIFVVNLIFPSDSFIHIQSI